MDGGTSAPYWLRRTAIVMTVLLAVGTAACGRSVATSGARGDLQADADATHRGHDTHLADPEEEAALARDRADAERQCRESTIVVDGRYTCTMFSETIESGFPFDAEPTEEQRLAAEQFVATVKVTTKRFENVAEARREGYTFDEYAENLASVRGTAAAEPAAEALRKGVVTHVQNPVLANDGVAADPTRPDVLMYLTDGDRYVLAGAMFLAPVGTDGPQFGGPLTVWHAHDHASRFVMCWDRSAVVAMPPALADGSKPADRPNGGCPRGAPTKETPEMLHVWFGQEDLGATFDHSMSIGDVEQRLR